MELKNRINILILTFIIGISLAGYCSLGDMPRDNPRDEKAENYDPSLAPLSVTSTFPKKNEENVSVDVEITATFNKKLSPSIDLDSSFELSYNDIPVEGKVRIDIEDNKILIFTPNEKLYGLTEYKAKLTSSIASTDGSKLSDNSWKFTTGIAPFLIESSESLNANMIRVTFNDPPNATQVEDVANYSISPELTVVSASVTEYNIITIFTNDRIPGDEYTVTLSNIIRMDDDVILQDNTFKIIHLTYIKNYSFEDGTNNWSPVSCSFTNSIVWSPTFHLNKVSIFENYNNNYVCEVLSNCFSIDSSASLKSKVYVSTGKKGKFWSRIEYSYYTESSCSNGASRQEDLGNNIDIDENLNYIDGWSALGFSKLPPDDATHARLHIVAKRNAGFELVYGELAFDSIIVNQLQDE
jgi:hypothetical protein